MYDRITHKDFFIPYVLVSTFTHMHFDGLKAPINPTSPTNPVYRINPAKPVNLTTVLYGKQIPDF